MKGFLSLHLTTWESLPPMLDHVAVSFVFAQSKGGTSVNNIKLLFKVSLLNLMDQRVNSSRGSNSNSETEFFAKFS